MARPPTPAQHELRAKRTLKMMLLALSGALISDASAGADYCARVRAASHKTRLALDSGESAHQALIQHLAPIFMLPLDGDAA